jgi:hypothetical protein
MKATSENDTQTWLSGRRKGIGTLWRAPIISGSQLWHNRPRGQQPFPQRQEIEPYAVHHRADPAGRDD